MAGQGIENSTAARGAWLSQTDERAIVEALARVAVDDAAPEEGPLFGPMADAYYDPRRGTPSGSKSDEMLGFGVDAAAAVVLVTPVALEVAMARGAEFLERAAARAARIFQLGQTS